MKNIVLFMLLFTCIIYQAQVPKNELKANGIFLSASEYKNHSLTLGFDKNYGFKFTKQKKLQFLLSEKLFKISKN
jgi:hypothetical protein